MSARIAPFAYVVSMPDGAPDYTVTRLFSGAESNTKLALSDAFGAEFITIGLSMAPALLNGLGVNLCAFASKVCLAICLMATGQARAMKNIGRARVAKSRLFILQPDAFKAQMIREISAARRKAIKLGKRLAVRLNVFSDVIWERKFPELFSAFPDVVFYDYTKVPGRRTPSNYRLTFSRSENNEAQALAVLHAGGNVAVVFEDHSFPETWHGFPVIDGTKHDLRFLDPTGHVVALAEKNTDLVGPQFAGKRNAKVDTRGFVLPTITSNVFGQELVTS